MDINSLLEKDCWQYVLFTGAGFTKNFGGLLASEMHSKIFNHSDIQQKQRLQTLLRENFDYESIYSDVMYGDYSMEEKTAVNEAIFSAYLSMDKTIASTSCEANSLNTHKLGEFIARLFPRYDHYGFLFYS